MVIDINSEIYPISEGDKIELLLTEELRPGGADSTEDGVPIYDPTLPLGETADRFEYIMYGRIFKFAEEKSRAYVLFPSLFYSTPLSKPQRNTLFQSIFYACVGVKLTEILMFLFSSG